MSEFISISETAAWLKEHDGFLILTHRRPDGDTLGCAGALASGLRRLGKTAYVLPNPEATPRYSPFVDEYWAPIDFMQKHTIAVDIASTDLFTSNALVYKDDVSLCIDHHDSNTGFAHKTCLSNHASCGEVVFEILYKLTGDISEKEAKCLYVAVSTDTGCFSFRNTTANTLMVASKLVMFGAPNKTLNKLLFRTKRRERIKIDSMVISGIEYCFGGKVAIAAVTRHMMEASGADEDDIDDIANIASSIEGVGIGITIRELSSTTDCKISVRTVPPYNACEICKHFGGGGHKSAAGASIEKTVDEIKADLLVILKDVDFSS